MMNNKRIPIFFACDDNFVKFTIVAITSLKANASKDYIYDIHILYTKMSEEMKKVTLTLSDETFNITFDDVTDYLKSVNYKLHVRDYYSKTTYYRLFISEMFPELDKALYIDSDMIILGDISELYNHELGDNYVGACNEQAMVQEECYGNYVEKCLGISRNKFFNAGMILINCKQFREKNLLERFIKLLHEYSFIVTQDEDYLNLICKDKVLWIENNWNVEMFGKLLFEPKDFKIIHYIMTSKPWHYRDCRHQEFFWEYAKQTPVYDQIVAVLDAYTDEQRANDKASGERLAQMAIDEANREDNYLNRQKLFEQKKETVESSETTVNTGIQKSPERLAVLAKIKEYEKTGRFEEDVEDDPPSRQIQPGEVDYQQKKLSSRIKAYFAFKAARNFIRKMVKSKQMIIKSVEGKENLDLLTGGAMITCNHFNALDSFAIQIVYDEIHKKTKHGKFFRIIKEGNYTSFPGFYGMLMRNCNTLPLSSSHRTMNEFLQAVKKLLADGNYILIYPEQSMWWNYRKPKPLRKGAYTLAVKNKRPVLPVFITMQDSDILDSDGFFVQEYTIHICKPIFPKPELSLSENVEYMMNENYSVWKKVYEETYKIPLKYEED